MKSASLVLAKIPASCPYFIEGTREQPERTTQPQLSVLGEVHRAGPVSARWVIYHKTCCRCVSFLLCDLGSLFS